MPKASDNVRLVSCLLITGFLVPLPLPVSLSCSSPVTQRWPQSGAFLFDHTFLICLFLTFVLFSLPCALNFVLSTRPQPLVLFMQRQYKRGGIFGYLLPFLTNGLLLSFVFHIYIVKLGFLAYCVSSLPSPALNFSCVPLLD